MATILDALIVTLGLDSSGMKKGSDDASKAQKKIEQDANKTAAALKKKDAEASSALKKKGIEEAKAAKEREASAKKAAEGLSKIRNEVLGIATAFLGIAALKGFGQYLINADTNLSRMSTTLGVSKASLNAWEVAASKFGATSEEVESAFGNVNKIRQEFKEGRMDSLMAYSMALTTGGGHIDTAKLTDRNISNEEFLLEISKETSALSQKDAAIALGRLGSAESIARYLHIGNIEVAKSLEAARALSPDIEKAGEGSERLSGRWAEFKAQVKGVGDTFLVAVLPFIEACLDKLAAFVDYAQKHIPQTEVVIAALGLAFAALSVNAIAGTLSALTGFAAKAGAATGAAGGLTTSLGLLATAVSALLQLGAAGMAGYAVGTFVKDWIDDVLSELMGKQTSLGAALYDRIQQIKKSLGISENAPTVSKGAPRSGASSSLGNFMPGASTNASITNAPTEIVQAAQASQAKYGIPAEVTIAQWKLESGSGKRMPAGSNNPFGIKAKEGQPYVEATTDEFINGQMQHIKQRFAKFDSIADAFDAHAKLLATGAAYANARSHKDDPQAFADALTGKYATDPNYGAKLKSLMNQSRIDPTIAQAMAPGAQIDRGLNTGAAAAATSNQSTTNSPVSHTSQTETHIGEININAPQAKTNADVASAIGEKLQSYAFASQANIGLA